MVVRRIGQILVDLGFITDEQLEVILDEQQQRPGALLGKIAEDMGLITDEQLAQALAEQLGMQTISLADVTLFRPTCWKRSRKRWRRCIASFRFSSMATA